MPSSGCFAPTVSGATYQLTSRPGKTVYYYFNQWKKAGRFEPINAALNQLDRHKAGRELLPSVVTINGQSVKLAPMICECRGLDANKRSTAASVPSWLIPKAACGWLMWRPPTKPMVARLCGLVQDILWRVGERLEKGFGDQAYDGLFTKELDCWSIAFEKASRPELTHGFVPVAKRWVVEPVHRCGSIAWTNFFRRIVKDYEYIQSAGAVSSSVSWLYLTNTQVMLQRIQPKA